MTKVAVLAKIIGLHLSNTPAHKIVTRPGFELWLPATPDAVAEQLCRNVYWFGHNENPVWVWGVGAAGNGTGEPLARGTVTNTNCGGFNLTARWIGYNVLNLNPALFAASFTLSSDYFITTAGTVGIDRNWPGNVRTLTQTYAQLGAYFFKGHSYCKYAGNLLDASTNTMNFHHKTDLYWCNLELAYTDLHQGRAFRVVQRRAAPPIPGPEPYAVVSTLCLKAFRHLFPIVIVGGGLGVTQSFIMTLPDYTGDQWESMLLVSYAHLPPAFRTAVDL